MKLVCVSVFLGLEISTRRTCSYGCKLYLKMFRVGIYV